ncbi:MAG: ribosomal protein S18-alanine N-acetyltransferase [Proteobacteria bacterium]|nr:ribosomal protein S18-alanine N-acetyltransferase [Pseudomonadota bacterium]
MLTVRAMVLDDLGAVGEIECHTLTPWSSASLRQELQVQKGLCLVAEAIEQGVVGWCACRRIWPEAELLRITVALRERKKGVGIALLQHLIRDLQEQNCTALFLEVRVQNKPALRFYYKQGFCKVGLRRGYYSGPQDDAIILKKDIC